MDQQRALNLHAENIKLREQLGEAKELIKEQILDLSAHKEALKLACQRICFHGHACPAELIADFDTFECNDNCDVVGQKPFDCWMKYFLTEAKEASSNG